VKYLIVETRLESLVKKFIKSKLTNYISFDEGMSSHNIPMGLGDTLIGKFIDEHDGIIVAILIDNQEDSDNPKYAIIDTTPYSQIRNLFELSNHKTCKLIAEACSEILGFEVQYSFEEKLN
jgi:hypothetical protein